MPAGRRSRNEETERFGADQAPVPDDLPDPLVGLVRLRDYSALRASPYGSPCGRSTSPDGEVVEPACLSVGGSNGWHLAARYATALPNLFLGVCRLRDYSALRASPYGSPCGRSTSPDGEVVEPACLSVGGSNGWHLAARYATALPNLFWGFAG
jgi:hypothetical protein